MLCILSEPSEDFVSRLIQVNSLIDLVDNCGGSDCQYFLPNETIPEDIKPKSFLTVNAETAKKFVSGKRKVPPNLGLKIKVNTEQPLSEVLDKLHKSAVNHVKTLTHSNSDPIVQAYINKYNLTGNNTIVIVWDQRCNYNINGNYLNNAISAMAAQLSQGDIHIIVFNMFPNGKPCGISGNNLTVVDGLPVNLLIPIATACKNHVLVGNNLGLLCASLSSGNCVCPRPWKAEGQNIVNNSWFAIKYNWPATKYYDHVYYINLDRRADRRLHMEQQLDRLNLSATRVQALDGKNIKWRPEFGIWSKFWNNGAFAYCLSYRQALMDAYAKGYENVLILDDDAVLTENFFSVLDKAWNSLPSNWHMLYLAANHGPADSPARPTENDKIGNNLCKLKGSVGSHAIIINKIAFPIILDFLASPYGPLDVYLSLYQQFFPCYITNPGIATQLAGHSDIINENVNYSEQVEYINYLPN